MTMTVMAFGMVIIFKMTTIVVIFLIAFCKEDDHAQKPDDDHGRHFLHDDHGCHTRTIMDKIEDDHGMMTTKNDDDG